MHRSRKRQKLAKSTPWSEPFSEPDTEVPELRGSQQTFKISNCLLFEFPSHFYI